MNLQKLNPWNWFKHEEQGSGDASHIPVKRSTVATPSAVHPAQLQYDIDRWLNQTLQSFGLPGLGNGPLIADFWRNAAGFRPSVNVSGDDKNYLVSLEAPGMQENNIHLELNKNILRIRGEKSEEHEDKDHYFYRLERSFGRFERTLNLPEDSDLDKIDAKMDKGILHITIPRRESAASEVKRIKINSAQ